MHSDRAVRSTLIIPSHRRGSLILKTLASVTHQTMAPHEVIVVNDGADAATEQVVRDVYPTFRVINIPQCGAAEARNVGARLAANDALLFLDDDDTLRHDAVEVLTTNLTAFPEAGASFGDHTFTDLVTGEHRPNHFAFLPHYE